MQNLAPNGKILRSFTNFYVRKTWKAVMLAMGRDSREVAICNLLLQPSYSESELGPGVGLQGVRR